MSRTLVTFLLATVCVVLLGVVGVGFVGGGLSGVGGGCVGVSGGGDVGELVGFARGGGDVGRWDGLLGRLRAGQDDPVYAAGVVDGVGVGCLVDVVVGVEEQLVREGVAVDYGYGRPGAGGEVAEVFGHMLAVVSGGWSAHEAVGAAKVVVSGVGDGGVRHREALNRVLLASRGVDVDGDGVVESVGLDYGDVFLSGLASGLEGLDEGGVGQWGVWSAGQEQIGPREPLAGVVWAMTGNAQVGLEWLAVGGGSGRVDGPSTAERVEALVGRGSVGANGWTDAWMLLAAQGALVQDTGAQGGDEVRAAVVSGVVEAVGYRSGQEPLSLSGRARAAASMVLAAYPYGVQRATATGGSTGAEEALEGSWSQGVEAQPWMSNTALSNLVGQVGQDDTAVARLAGSQEAFNRAQVAGEAAAVQDGAAPEALGGALEAQSRTRGFIVGAIVRTSGQRDQDADARVGAWAAASTMAVSAAPQPQDTTPNSYLTTASSYTTHTGTNAAAQGSSKGITGTRNDTDDSKKSDQSKEQAAKEVNSYAVSYSIAASTLIILRSGIYTQDELKAIGQKPGYDSIIDKEGVVLESAEGSFLNGDQMEALRLLAGRLPRKYDVLPDVVRNSGRHYSAGYDSGV